jgi:hypothetical protein
MSLRPPLTRKARKAAPKKSAKTVHEPVRKSALIPKSKLERPRQPERPGRGGTDPGPRNTTVDAQNPDLFIPLATDAGILPNLRFSFADATHHPRGAGEELRRAGLLASRIRPTPTGSTFSPARCPRRSSVTG